MFAFPVEKPGASCGHSQHPSIHIMQRERASVQRLHQGRRTPRAGGAGRIETDDGVVAVLRENRTGMSCSVSRMPTLKVCAIQMRRHESVRGHRQAGSLSESIGLEAWEAVSESCSDEMGN